MKNCVLIEVAEDGQVTVGAYPGELPPEFKQGLQPVESVDAALEQARQLLTPEGEQTPAQAEQSFQKGYSHGRGTPMFEGV